MKELKKKELLLSYLKEKDYMLYSIDLKNNLAIVVKPTLDYELDFNDMLEKETYSDIELISFNQLELYSLNEIKILDSAHQENGNNLDEINNKLNHFQYQLNICKEIDVKEILEEIKKENSIMLFPIINSFQKPSDIIFISPNEKPNISGNYVAYKISENDYPNLINRMEIDRETLENGITNITKVIKNTDTKELGNFINNVFNITYPSLEKYFSIINLNLQMKIQKNINDVSLNRKPGFIKPKFKIGDIIALNEEELFIKDLIYEKGMENYAIITDEKTSINNNKSNSHESFKVIKNGEDEVIIKNYDLLNAKIILDDNKRFVLNTNQRIIKDKELENIEVPYISHDF